MINARAGRQHPTGKRQHDRLKWEALGRVLGRYLGGHPTPEVGVGRSGVQHGRDDRLVFPHELPQQVGVGEEVVAVHQLHRTDRQEGVSGRQTRSGTPATEPVPLQKETV